MDDVKPEMDVYKDEIFGPVLGSRAWTPTTRPSGS